MTIRVLIADSHAPARHNLKIAFEGESEIEIVGEAEDGWSAVVLAHKLRPDIVIMDIRMTELNGIEATREITASMPEIKVIGFSVHTEKRYINGMLEAGAACCLSKTCAFQELLQALCTAYTNQG